MNHRNGRAIALASGTLLTTAMLVATPTNSWTQPALGAWIDPGHGGTLSPVGAPGIDGDAPPNEKHLTLAVSLVVKSRLGQLGYLSLLTRNSDHDLGRTQRTLIAAGKADNDEGEREEAVVFVSVHMDGVDDSTQFGTFIIFPGADKIFKKSKRSYRVDSTLAWYMDPALQSNAAAAFLGCHDPRDLRQDVEQIQVLHASQIPSVLVECCFISNRCQFNNIRQAGDQGLIANGIATGIANYLGQPEPQRLAFVHEPMEVSAPFTRAGLPRSILSPGIQEEFEGGTFPPAGWTLAGSGASVPYTWHRSTDPLYVGAGAGAALVVGESPGAIDELLISPMFLVTAADSTLRFRWLGNPTFVADLLGTCAVRRKGESTWTSLWTLAQETQGLAFKYPERAVSIGTWLGDSVQVGFRVVGTNGADFGVDAIATGLFPLTSSPPNDLCQAATPLPVGSFTLAGNTCYATNNRDPFTPGGNACVSDEASGGDVFYSVNALADDTLRVHLPASAAAFTHLYLLSSCDSLSATCLAGKEPSGGEEDSSLTHVFAADGTYYLVVDVLPSSCGEFSLTGTLRGPVTGVGDDVSSTQGLRIGAWPNPARTGVRFVGRAESGLRGNGRLRIFDATGRAVYTREFAVNTEHFEVSWDGRPNTGPRVPAGVYLARFELGAKANTVRVVISE